MNGERVLLLIADVGGYFVEVDALAGPLPELPDPALGGRIAATVSLLGRGVPSMLRLRSAHVEFAA